MNDYGISDEYLAEIKYRLNTDPDFVASLTIENGMTEEEIIRRAVLLYPEPQ